MTRVAFFGLGAMGAPMAARLASSAFAVAAFDRDPDARDRWAAAHRAADFAPSGAAVAVTCVTDEAALAALADDTLLQELSPGALWIDHTTTSAALARRLAARCDARGIGFVDAPVSGGADGASRGALVAMLGGSESSVARARPLLAAYAARIVHLGPPGSGQTAKMANQVAIAGTVRALAEAVSLARRGGLDVAALLDALAAGTAASAQLERTRTIWTEGGVDFAAAFAWLGKDLDLALAEAARLGAPLELAALVAASLRAGDA